MDLFVKIIKMRYCSYSCKIAHHFKYLSIFRREVVTKQTEGYSQQQQEEEEEILVFQVQSIPCLSKNSKIAAKFNPHHYHGSGRSLSHCSWCCSHSSSQSRRVCVSSTFTSFYKPIMTWISRGSPGDLVVRCGEWDTQTTGEPLDHQVCSLRKESWVLHAEL